MVPVTDRKAELLMTDTSSFAYDWDSHMEGKSNGGPVAINKLALLVAVRKCVKEAFGKRL